MIVVCEHARRWLVANPEQTATLIAGETQLPVEVIRCDSAATISAGRCLARRTWTSSGRRSRWPTTSCVAAR